MMTICATKLTPEVLLSAPRRSAGSPNSTGKLVLYTTSTYSFNDHKKTVQIHVLEVDSGRSTSLYRDSAYSEPTWVSETEFLLIRNGEKGTSSLLVADVKKPGATPQEISKFPGSIANLKVKQLSNGNIALACSAVVTPKGDMYSPEADKKSLTTAKVYTSLFARHWDSWLTENRNAIFYGSLNKTSSGSYALEAPGLVNVLKGTKLQSPVPPFGGTGDFDLGPAGLVFVALDPELSPALYTKSDLYFVPLRSFTEDTPPVPQLVKTGALRGFSGAPTFSHSGNAVVFTRMRSDQYESDKTRLVLVPDIRDLANVQEFYATPDGEGGWDRRAESALWSADDSELYVTAEDEGRTKLFRLPASPLAARELPQIISQIDGSINDVKLVQDASSSTAKLFISASSITDSSFYTTLDLSSSAKSASPTHTLVSSHSKQGRVFGLSRSQVSEIRFPGGRNGDYEVQAWVVKPSTFDANSKTKYPLAMLIHGGPQSSWGDSWSTRWNPAVFAEQGYVVVCPNFTGSTGFGMALQNGIRENWGGRPYEDIVACFDYVARTMGNVVDVDRAVALGASYGGYMVNWIQGHELGRRFKALVCHDGVFSTLNQYSSEELFFPIHDFGGQFWANRAGYEKWDPARFTNEWATPQLVIHNELDYRLPISEGLAAFNVLQSRGIPSKLLVFTDENHWVLKPENSLVWHREVLDWINKYSGAGDGSLMP